MLDLAAVVRIGAEFSPAEQDRARAAAARDPRLGVALEAAGYGLTQTLAAAPQLVARWEDAQTASPYAWAVLTAALDAARLGARAPLSADLLRAAAPGYCTSQQQAEAPDNWFEQALAYATGKLHGAAAALSPAGAGMGQVAGYTVADYLIQHASRERRYARVPASTWDAVLSHIRDPADAARLADSARNRLLYRYAIPLYRHAADAGDEDAAGRLAELLAERGDLDGLRARADAGDEDAAGSWPSCWPSAATWTSCAPGPTPATGRRRAAGRAAGRARRPGRAARPGRRRRRVPPPGRLAELLAERGDLDGLRARADAGDEAAAGRLAELLAERGDLDGLRARADAGDEDAAGRLAELLAERGDLDGAAQILRARADAGDGDAAMRLAELLAERGDLDGLRARADAGDKDAAWRLAELLAERGDLDGLRARADAGDEDAAWRLAELLAERGDLDELRARADAGDGYAAAAAGRAAGRARRPGRAARPGRRRRPSCRLGSWPGCWPSAATWTGPHSLRARADAGDGYAASQLARLLAERGDLDGAAVARPGRRRRRGRRRAAGRAAGRARRPGRGRRLRARADAGDGSPLRQLAGLLAERGDLDGAAQILRALADAGDVLAAWAAGHAAGRARRPGRAARPGPRRRRGRRPETSRTAD